MQNLHNKKDTLQCLSPKSVLYFLDIFVANVLQMRCELSKFHRFSPHLTTPQILVKQGFERKSEFLRLSLAELRCSTSCLETVLKFFDCHFSLIFWAFLPFRFSVVLFLNHKNRCFLLLRFKLQSLKNVSHNTIILKQSNSKTLFPSIF